MNISMKYNVAYVQGDVTCSGISRSSINSMSDHLRRLETGRGERVSIDCSSAGTVDTCGLQLLSVWMQCARFRGYIPVLVNVPENMLKALPASFPARLKGERLSTEE